jgi:hypothetical protein
LGRLIKTETVGKERTHLVRGIVVAIRELMRQEKTDGLTADLAAFIALALEVIAETIDGSVVAWEKRGYWVKADRFRLEWDWAGRLGGAMRQAVLSENWAKVAEVAVQVAGKLSHVQVPVNHRLGTPWVGAYQRMKDKG